MVNISGVYSEVAEYVSAPTVTDRPKTAPHVTEENISAVCDQFLQDAEEHGVTASLREDIRFDRDGQPYFDVTNIFYLDKDELPTQIRPYGDQQVRVPFLSFVLETGEEEETALHFMYMMDEADHPRDIVDALEEEGVNVTERNIAEQIVGTSEERGGNADAEREMYEPLLGHSVIEEVADGSIHLPEQPLWDSYIRRAWWLDAAYAATKPLPPSARWRLNDFFAELSEFTTLPGEITRSFLDHHHDKRRAAAADQSLNEWYRDIVEPVLPRGIDQSTA